MRQKGLSEMSEKASDLFFRLVLENPLSLVDSIESGDQMTVTTLLYTD